MFSEFLIGGRIMWAQRGWIIKGKKYIFTSEFYWDRCLLLCRGLIKWVLCIVFLVSVWKWFSVTLEGVNDRLKEVIVSGNCQRFLFTTLSFFLFTFPLSSTSKSSAMLPYFPVSSWKFPFCYILTIKLNFTECTLRFVESQISVRKLLNFKRWQMVFSST